MATPGLVGAKTFIVNSTLDETDTNPGDGVCVGASGYCTLRAAIQEANDFPGPDVIKLKTGLYMLTIPGISENACATGDLDINDNLAIIGTGAKNTFINGGKLE
jgi:CSLREA domain-containing protein